uniref:LPS-assembly lipoprotein LptE n=1 Tax=Thaumasiovibrio occultus TaxID=1891184 RepID=UPI000B356785|nr:LPS assembly lipoprotein LptE [Thaumasiovibrio occultus]
MSTLLRRFGFLALLASLLSGCGFSLRSDFLLPDEASHISVSAFDKYSAIGRILTNQFPLYGVEKVSPSADVPHLHITNESIDERTLSLYQNSRRAEYELTYVVNYTITVADKPTLNLSTTVNRNFLDNPQTALAKQVERDMVENEMREQAASQIMRQLARLNTLYEEADENE